jgi:pimeloyl-ACP methyl ester carboxylesterase
MNRFVPLLLILALGTLALAQGDRPQRVAQTRPSEIGTVTTRGHPNGQYVQYIPRSGPVGILVIVHGTPDDDEPALDTSRRYVKEWLTFAEQQRALIIAPVFDQENFGSREGPGGGFRGLHGRHVGADEFLNRLIDSYLPLFPRRYDGRVLLCGHSAGGQFVSRYVVRHPDRVRAAVISAAANFAWPNPEVAWQNGMGRLRRTMQWPGGPQQQVDITPDPEGWMKAAALPLTAVVGAKDTEPCKPITGQVGANHVERAVNWINEMNRFAREAGRPANARYLVVEGIGHTSRGLAPTCGRALLRQVAPVPAPEPDAGEPAPDEPPAPPPSGDTAGAAAFAKIEEGRECGAAGGRQQYLVNTHESRTIRVVVRRSWTVRDKPMTKDETIVVRPGPSARKRLGCSARIVSGQQRVFGWTIVSADFR